MLADERRSARRVNWRETLRRPERGQRRPHAGGRTLGGVELRDGRLVVIDLLVDMHERRTSVSHPLLMLRLGHAAGQMLLLGPPRK